MAPPIVLLSNSYTIEARPLWHPSYLTLFAIINALPLMLFYFFVIFVNVPGALYINPGFNKCILGGTLSPAIETLFLFHSLYLFITY